MKKDVFLIIAVVAILMFALQSFIPVGFIFKLIFGLLIVGLFLYKQIKPYKNALFPQYLQRFTFIEKIYDGIFKVFRLSPVKLGNNLSMDLSAILFLVLLILLIII